jgi:hypothetical protein
MSKPFNLLDEFGKFGADRRLSLRYNSLMDAFIERVGLEMRRALEDPILLHGRRTEAMFDVLLLALNHFQLLKREDGGAVSPPGAFSVPDFRVVLPDGQHWLIEVKNVCVGDPGKQVRRVMTQGYRRKLKAYADATKADLKLGVYWARWSLWTLVTPEAFIDERGDVAIDMGAALTVAPAPSRRKQQPTI